MGRFGLTPLEASRMTEYEFHMYALAHQVKMQEAAFLSAQQAWLNQSVQATKKAGKSVKSAYKDFNDFYNSEREFKQIFSPAEKGKKKLSMAEMNRRLNKKGG